MLWVGQIEFKKSFFFFFSEVWSDLVVCVDGCLTDISQITKSILWPGSKIKIITGPLLPLPLWLGYAEVSVWQIEVACVCVYILLVLYDVTVSQGLIIPIL